mmetsp:Transcript_48538/g.95754  ORF Transcript_48538/g.95754 Transcript_48538/m.95754 type:complete len:133 (-) Transcript_48538:1885-2283(-)
MRLMQNVEMACRTSSFFSKLIKLSFRFICSSLLHAIPFNPPPRPPPKKLHRNPSGSFLPSFIKIPHAPLSSLLTTYASLFPSLSLQQTDRQNGNSDDRPSRHAQGNRKATPPNRKGKEGIRSRLPLSETQPR